MPSLPARPDPLYSWRALALFTGWWALLGVLFAVQLHMMSSLQGGELPWSRALITGLVDTFSWGAVALVVFWLCGRLQPSSTDWLVLSGIHVVAAFALVPGRLMLAGVILDSVFGQRLSELTTVERIVIASPTNLLIYVMLIAVGYAYHFVRRYRKRELVAAQLQASLAGAELEVMKMLLQPPFLARGLRSISVLMNRDLLSADRGLALLGDMLRMTLQRSHRQTVSLKEELELLELFVTLQQEELGDRLRVTWDCEPAALDAEVPSLLLQPAVEQVIHRDYEPNGGPIQLTIGARIRTRTLELEVVSCGVHQDSGRTALEPGVLATVRARLDQLYGVDPQRYVVECRDSCTVVRFRIPCTEAAGRSADNAATMVDVGVEATV